MRGAEDSDETLIRRAGEGDRAAAGALVLRHADKAYAIAYRMLGDRASAEDAAQEAFLKVWKHAARWKPQGAKFETWLYRIVANACLDRLRRRGRERPEDEAPERADGALLPDQQIEQEQRRDAVERALAALPERQRMAITLCHFQELSNIDAAAVMEISVDALESLLARGRRTLRSKLLTQKHELLEGADHDASPLAS